MSIDSLFGGGPVLDGFVKPRLYSESICVRCRGRDLLCGKPVCPVILEYRALMESYRELYREDIYGASPPSVFIGRMGYPKVSMGVLTPPETGDTSIYDYPERWHSLGLEDILRLRSRLVLGWRRVDKHLPSRGDRLYHDILDLAIARRSPEVEIHLEKRPVRVMVIDEDITPFGPRAPVKSLSLGSLKIDYRIEKRVGDTDLPAEEGVVELYRSGVEVSRIIRVFSMGGLGRRGRRVLVPTRWSITAVDDILGRWLYRRVRRYPEIDTYLVYEKDFLENRYVALLIPGPWMYEFMEAWYPGTFWNRLGTRVVVEGSAEFGRPRREYADIGGCYYASRLATLEYLDRIGRQASVVIFREAYPGYVFPVGVWSVRESVRMLFRERPLRFESLGEALNHVFSRLRTPRDMWRSEVIDFWTRQRRLGDYL